MHDLARVLLLPFLLHSCATGMRFTATLDALARGADALAVGVMLASVSFLPAFLAVRSGRWIDRRGAAGAVFASMGVAALSGLAALLPPFVPEAASPPETWLRLVPLLLACPLAGVSFMLVNTSTQRLVGDVSAPGARRNAFTMLSLVTASSNLLTPVLAGHVIEGLGFRAVYLWCILAPAVLGTVFLLPAMNRVLRKCERPHAPAANRKASGAHAAELLRDPPLRAVIVASVLVSVTWEVGNLLIPVHAAACGLSPADIGWVLGSFAAATFIVRFLMPLLMRRAGEWLLISSAFAVAGAALSALSVLSSLQGLMAAAFVLGLGLGASLPNMMTLVYLFAPPERIGETIGLRIMLINIGRATFPVLAGAAGAVLGAGASLAGLSLLAFGGFLHTRLCAPAVRIRLQAQEVGASDGTPGKNLTAGRMGAR